MLFSVMPGIMFEFEGSDRLVLELVANDAAEGCHRTGASSERRLSARPIRAPMSKSSR